MRNYLFDPVISTSGKETFGTEGGMEAWRPRGREAGSD